MIDVSDLAVTRLLHELRRGIDPLQVGGEPIDQRVRMKAAAEAALDGMDAATAAAVALALATKLGSGHLGGNPRGTMPIDPTMATLLAAAGIDPLAATWIAVICGMLDLDDHDSGLLVGQVDGTCAVDSLHQASWLMLERGVDWKQRGWVELPAAPDTLVAAAPGRPLRDIVSHPVLDALALTVTTAETRRRTTIVTTHMPTPATMEELLAAAPHGCR